MNAAAPPAPPPSPPEAARLLPLAMRVLPSAAAVVAGTDCRVVAANEAWCLLSGGSAGLEGSLGYRLGELFPRATAAAAGAFCGGGAASAISLRDLPLASRAGGDAATWWDLDIVPHPEAEDALLVTARDVTEGVLARREAEAAREALDATAARLRLAQEAAGVGSWEWDIRADRLAWSPEQFRLHGLDADRDPPPTSAAWFAMVHEEDRPLLHAAAEDGFRDARGHYQVEFRLRRADTGEERWLLSRGRVAEAGPDGRPLRILGVNLDVTGRRREQEALRENEERVRLALDAAELGVWSHDLASGTVRLDARAGAQYGIDAEAAPIGEVVARIHPEDRPALERAVGAAVDPAVRGPVAVEYRVLDPAAPGGVRWLSVFGRVHFDGEGPAARAARGVGTVQDITARRAAEAALAEGDARLRATYAASATGLALVDRDLRFVLCNERLAAIDGVPAAEHVGRTVREVVPGLADRLEPLYRGVLETGVPVRDLEVEGETVAAPGEARWWLANYDPVRGAGGAVTGVSVSILEITDRKRAEQGMAESEARLRALAGDLERRVAERTRALSDAANELAAEMRRREEAQATLLQSQKLEALGQLTGGVAHDFNNILAAIQGGYRLLERRVQDPQARGLIEHGAHAAERGAKLIAGLMAFARREELRPERVDPAALLRVAEDMIRHTAGRRVRCAFEVAPEAWPVIVDAVRLETVLLNLAANARDAMPEGGTLTVALRNARPDELPGELPPGQDHVLVSVADTGCGMDEATLRRAAEPFFTTKPVGKGTGLGLASAHGFAVQSGGALRLRSAPGQGTTVEIFLPRAGVLGPVGEAGDAAVLDRSRHGGATLLVVDDDEAVRPVTAGLLRGLGYRVVEAPSAEAAEALAHGEGAIDMLVTDVVMGGVSGPVLAARLRAERPDLPVLYVTGRAGTAALGDAPVVRKPFAEAELARAVLAGLGRLGAGKRPAGLTSSERLRERLRRPALREAYLRWLALRGGAAGALPSPATFRVEDLPEAARDGAFLAEALGEDCAGGFRFLHVGRALEERLGRVLTGTVVEIEDGGVGEALGGSLCATYRRCAATHAPLYDYARVSPGDGGPGLLVERLVLPLSADGVAVTHVAGVALFSELPAPDGAAEASPAGA